MSGWFELKKTESGKFFFVLKADNARTILVSEMYESKAAAQKGIASVQVNSQLDERFDKREAKDGQFYFVLKAGNHEIIGNSEMYPTESVRDKGIEAVMRAGASTTIKEV